MAPHDAPKDAGVAYKHFPLKKFFGFPGQLALAPVGYI